MNCSQLADLIGSRFVADPGFGIYINRNPVTLEDLKHLCDVYSLKIDDIGTVERKNQ
jgi:hypothetical protein